jgi:hypothetical protein
MTPELRTAVERLCNSSSRLAAESFTGEVEWLTARGWQQDEHGFWYKTSPAKNATSTAAVMLEVRADVAAISEALRGDYYDDDMELPHTY